MGGISRSPSWKACRSRQLTAKCVLFGADGEAKDECGVDQLCAGLEAGMEGGIHAMRLLWEQHAAEEEWGFLLVDARNVFNEGNALDRSSQMALRCSVCI
jgi:hypothetical protein